MNPDKDFVLVADPKPYICKQCGYEIKEDRDDDLCSNDCKIIYDAIKQLEERFASQEGR